MRRFEYDDKSDNAAAVVPSSSSQPPLLPPPDIVWGECDVDVNAYPALGCSDVDRMLQLRDWLSLRREAQNVG